MPKFLAGLGLVLDASAWHTVGPPGMKNERSEVPGPKQPGLCVGDRRAGAGDGGGGRSPELP